MAVIHIEASANPPKFCRGGERTSEELHVEYGWRVALSPPPLQPNTYHPSFSSTSPHAHDSYTSTPSHPNIDQRR